MELEKVYTKVKQYSGLPRNSEEKLYSFVLKNKITNILEIGFRYGGSTNIMAAALHELGRGKITTIDLKLAQKHKPNIIELSKQTGLLKYISPIFSEMGSSWEIRKMIIDNTKDNITNPIFDFCFIDGSHCWESASLDFLLSEKLLKPGGWILFDDLDWSFSASPTLRSRPETKAMPEDYRNACQVGDVFEYLVKQHPKITDFESDGRWGWARKSAQDPRKSGWQRVLSPMRK